jgi:transcriptional regulator with XRE-family HTH domain
VTRLEQLRKDALLTVKDLAKQTRVSHRTIYALESGDVKDPQMKTLARLSTFFGVPASELLLDALPSFTPPQELREAS